MTVTAGNRLVRLPSTLLLAELAVVLALWSTTTCLGQNLTYDQLLSQNEFLRAELSNLRSRLEYFSNECKCPSDQNKCNYEGKVYEYLESWKTDACQTCTCVQNGEVKCQYDSSRPECSEQCTSNPCLNGGTCISRNYTYVCVCPPDCTGKQCEVREAHTCSLPLDQGQVCADDVPSKMWYYDALRGYCLETEYNGCGGNSNKFTSRTLCEDRCSSGRCCIRESINTGIMYGHSSTGFDRYGFKEGFDQQGFPATVKTATAFGEMRYRFNGVDYRGYRRDGYNRDRYARAGYDCQGVNLKGFNMDKLAAGFNFSCEVMTLQQCRSKSMMASKSKEVISFTAGSSDCDSDACSPLTADQCQGCRYHGKFYKYEESFSNGCNQCICTRMGGVQCTCSKTIKRKEVRDMTAKEVENYQRAIAQLYANGKWTDLSNMYAKYLPHSHSNEDNFLPWHRAMLHYIEMELQKVSGSCDLSIPYFDWTMDAGALIESPIWRAGLFGGNGGRSNGCVEYHPFASMSWSPCLRRKFNATVAIPDVVSLERVKRSKSLYELSNKLKAASLLFRLWVGGHAASIHTTYDPVMVSHYAFIDKVWHEWQTRKKNYLLLEPSSRYKPLEPFAVSADDVNGSPQQICIDYSPLSSLCISDVVGQQGRPYNLAGNRAFDSGFDSSGFDRLGYNRRGFNGDGFDKQGYDTRGYDRYGFDRSGVSPHGVTRSGERTNTFDSTVLDKQNYTKLGLDHRGVDFNGYDIFGYDTRGYDSDGCNAHFQDGYHYVKQKYKIDLKLAEMTEDQLNKIARLCADLRHPPYHYMIMSWVVVDSTHALRSSPSISVPQNTLKYGNIWVPNGPDFRFCAEINIFSPCEFGEVHSDGCGTDMCSGLTCPAYDKEAHCRTVGCDGICRREWYYNGQIVTSSCSGCVDKSSSSSKSEGSSWVTVDGCQRCQCVQGASRCSSNCQQVLCQNPDLSSCCPTCMGCTYENQTYSDGAVFQSKGNPCERCKCEKGNVQCFTRACPSMANCRDSMTLSSSCCAVCLSCGDKRNGERWYESDCNVCQCQDGVTRCTEVTCGTPSCTHPVKIPGVCCPQCKACSYKGLYYRNGQTFQPDQCETCTCNNGNVTCSGPECPELSCSNPYKTPGTCCPKCLEGCEYSGKLYGEGDIFTPSFNPCMNCSCSDRKVRCGPVNCPLNPELKCSRPVALPGDCCPSFCPSCVYGGKEYGHGDRWKPAARPCDACLCYNGVVTCRSTIRCYKTCAYGVYEEGQCCSSCIDCKLDGQLHKNGSSFVHVTDDGCTECKCTEGNIVCSSPKASCPPSDCTNPVQPLGTCCPRCPTCKNGKNHRDRWRNELNSCEICECFDGKTNCYSQPCLDSDLNCLSPVTIPGECCPRCLDCTVGDARYQNGSAFELSDRPCQQCSCNSGNVECNRLPCPYLSCDKPVMLPGRCCPSCIARKCNYKGTTHPEGSRFADGCSECECLSGRVKCRPRSCPAVSCRNPVMSQCCPSCSDCNWNSRVLRQGERILNDATCEMCTCVSGTVSCRQPASCPPVSCTDPVTSGCCPVCNEGCDISGVIIPENRVVDALSDDCTICLCQNGSVSCSPSHPDCLPLPPDCPKVSTKDCCPICDYSCELDGITFNNGQNVPSGDRCLTCACSNGKMVCSATRSTCPSLRPDCPKTVVEDCCPVCDDSCQADGITYRHGQGMPFDDKCVTCACLNGKIDCKSTKSSCPDVPPDCPKTVIEDCCVICDYSCQLDGITYRNGQGMPSGDNCLTCACNYGKIDCKSTNSSCPDVPPDCPKTVTEDCCVICDYSCQLDGITYRNGQGMPSGDNCLTCACSYGKIDCKSTDSSCLDVPPDCPKTVTEDCCVICDYSCQLDGITYRNGQGMPSGDKCLTCSCDYGKIDCKSTKSSCPDVPPDCPKTVIEDCCVICDSSCQLDGITYRNGQGMPSGDKCLTCACDYGNMACNSTRSTCPSLPSDCPKTAVKDCCQVCDRSCDVDGRTYQNNDPVPSGDRCLTCTCSNGKVDCSSESCPEPRCTHPVKDGCCYTCSDGCQHDNRVYSESDEVYSSNPCEVCICKAGSVVCESKLCPSTDHCSSTRLVKGECCPKCSGCQLAINSTFISPASRTASLNVQDGLIKLSDGESYKNTDSCETCVCLEGGIQCEPTRCQSVSCTHPSKSNCCPECNDCVYRGSLYQDGEVFPDPNDQSCSQCYCSAGNVICSRLDCPLVTCSAPPVGVDKCGCPVCATCITGEGNYTDGDVWKNEKNCNCQCYKGEVLCQGCTDKLACHFTEVDSESCCGVKCKSCLVDGIAYSNGATWMDGACSSLCSCNGGVVSCLDDPDLNAKCSITPAGCQSLPDKSQCCNLPVCACLSPDNVKLNVGEIFKVNSTDRCTVCTCTKDFSLECYQPVCPSISRCSPDKIIPPDKNSCCSTCEGEIEYDCTDSLEGTTTSSTLDPCVECTCEKNTWKCQEKSCPLIECPLSERLTKPGQCCPTCAGCYTADVKQAHGSSWQYESDPCTTCKCEYGEVKCERSIVCPPLFCTEGRKPFTPEGQCCQVCGDPVTGDDCLDNSGRTRAHGSGWPVDDCTTCECLFGKVNCTSESCPPLECLSDQTLVIEEGVCCPSCVKQPAVCKVYGDPHYKTFDGETIHFQGFCSYEMVKDCDQDSFKITAIHDDRDTLSVSWIKSMIIETGDLKIRLGRGLWCEVNKVNVTFPFQHSSGVVIRQLPAAIQVAAEKQGFKVTWDGSAYGEVEVDTKLKTKLCGLCGNFNDNPKDELTMKDGVLTNSHASFGESWLVPGLECSAEAREIHPCDTAGYDVKKKAIEKCSLLQSEVFKPCHRVVPPDDYVFSCVYDMCACNGTEACLCDILTTYSTACKNSYVNIQWRTGDRCAIKCDESRGFIFDECGPACPKTCENYNEPLREECRRPCEPSCQCPAGLVQYNGRCVTTDMCPK